jgi:hypothetical protein
MTLILICEWLFVLFTMELRIEPTTSNILPKPVITRSKLMAYVNGLKGELVRGIYDDNVVSIRNWLFDDFKPDVTMKKANKNTANLRVVEFLDMFIMFIECVWFLLFFYDMYLFIFFVLLWHVFLYTKRELDLTINEYFC